MDDNPKPMGFWTRWHIAHDPRWTKHYEPESFSPMLNQSEIPPITPVMKAAGTFLYSEIEVDRWFAALEKWIEEAPIRKQARKELMERAIQNKLDAYMKEVGLQQEVLKAHLESEKQYQADREILQGDEVVAPASPLVLPNHYTHLKLADAHLEGEGLHRHAETVTLDILGWVLIDSRSIPITLRVFVPEPGHVYAILNTNDKTYTDLADLVTHQLYKTWVGSLYAEAETELGKPEGTPREAGAEGLGAVFEGETTERRGPPGKGLLGANPPTAKNNRPKPGK